MLIFQKSYKFREEKKELKRLRKLNYKTDFFRAKPLKVK